MNIEEQMRKLPNINERQFLKNTYFDKAELLKEWDAVRIPILQELKRRGKDIRLKVRSKK